MKIITKQPFNVLLSLEIALKGTRAYYPTREKSFTKTF